MLKATQGSSDKLILEEVSNLNFKCVQLQLMEVQNFYYPAISIEVNTHIEIASMILFLSDPEICVLTKNIIIRKDNRLLASVVPISIVVHSVQNLHHQLITVQKFFHNEASAPLDTSNFLRNKF